MKKLLVALLAGAAFLVGLTAPAEAAPARVDQVAPITCYPNEDSCVVEHVTNGGNGYYMARQQNGSTWVRLTLVPGWDNSFVAPITCRYATSCVLDYVGISQGSFWRAKQAVGSVWVRLTLVNGA